MPSGPHSTAQGDHGSGKGARAVHATVGGAPVAVEGVETVMVFYTDDSTTTGEVTGYTLLIVVLLPIALILSAASNGSIHWGND